MKKIFINKYSQIRSGWKIVITLTFYLITVLTSGIIIGIISTIMIANNDVMFMITALIQQILSIVSVVMFWKILDKRPISDLGLISLRAGLGNFTAGLIFGAISITVVFFVLLVSGNVRVIRVYSDRSIILPLLTGLILFVFVGFSEEMFSRGYCMTVLKQTGNRWVMVLVSSAIFSVEHSLNPNIKILGFINIFLVGMLFAFMFIKSGNLWMPIGYHITWNYFQGNIFGFEVSGNKIQGLITTRPMIENILNGGSFGPEGGLITTAVIMLGFLIIWVFYSKSSFHLH